MSNNGAYERNLRHIAEPGAPSEREKATSTTLPDWVALWFADVLREYAHYEADEPHDGIAVGLASYIDSTVRDQGESYVTIYVHTMEAVDAVTEAATYGDEPSPDPRAEVASTIGNLRYEVGKDEPEVVEVDGEETVAYDEDEARDSLAEKAIAEAESEALKELEADADMRGINGRKTPRVNPRWNE